MNEREPGPDQNQSLINDPRLMRAVSNIQKRADRVDNPTLLVATFVDTGAIAQIDNNTNQIIYGRRGTGKSHVVGVLREQAPPDTTAVYVDCRLLGSSGSALQEAPARVRAASIFRDIFQPVSNALLDAALQILDRDQSERAFAALDSLGNELFGWKEVGPSSSDVTETVGGTRTRESRLSANVTAAPEVSASLGSTRSSKQESIETFKVDYEQRLNFQSINRNVNQTLDCIGASRLLILIDEWAEITPSDQPLVAEYLKKAFFANGRVTVKIAALEYRSNFSEMIDGVRIGLELGGDVFASADLDDYFLPDRDPNEVQRAYAQLIHRHLASTFEGDLAELGLTEWNIPSRLCTQTPVFQELVRASEGVPRDFINIFTQAFFDARRRSRPTIDMQAVTTAARKWYEQDKRGNLSPEQERLLHRIITEVIGERKARCFMLEQRSSHHSTIRALYDLRVIHRLKAGYSGRYNPGVRYDIYSLDYGTYVEFRNTSAAPDAEFERYDGEPPVDAIVPFEDNRSIRRVILDPAILDSTEDEAAL